MNASRLKVQPDLRTQFGYFWMTMLGVYYACLFLVSRQDTRDSNIKLLIIATGFSVAMSGWCRARLLADGMRVLGASPTPRTLWKAWLRNGLGNLVARWGLAVLVGTIALSLDGATWSWSAAVFLYSVILTLSMIASFSHHGVWHWAWSACIVIGVAIIIAFIGWHGLEQLLRARVRWHLSVALSWPLLAAYLAWWWQDHPPQGVAMRRRTQFNLLQRLAGYVKRYTRLDPAFQRTRPKNGQGAAIFVLITPMLYLCILRTVGLKAQWGKQVGFLYIGSLVLMAILANAMLVCKDLHWRRLLAPDGFPRGRLGWHIIVSTLTAVVAIVLALLICLSVVLIFFAWGGIRVSTSDLLKTLSPYAVFPLEFVLAVCMGTVLRGARRPLVASALILFAFLAVGTSAILMLGMKAALGFFVIGPGYVICLLVATGAAIIVANRVWTTQRLLPYIVAGVSESDDIVEGGRWFFWPGRSY